jgi:hypothetical protein
MLGLKRPRLCAAKAILSPLNLAHSLSGNRSARLAEFTEKLDDDIRTKEKEREELFKSFIGNSLTASSTSAHRER